MSRDFLTLEGIEREELKEVLDLAGDLATGRLARPLSGKTVWLAFFEASTRTAVSFELAARRAGADAIVVRHPSAGAAALAAYHTDAAVINAGDGRGQHPTQALLDLYALSNALSDFDELLGRKVAIVGDVLHSRVARSVIPAFSAAGMEVALVAPDTLLPREAGTSWNLPILPSVDDALGWGAEVLYALRLQKERMTGALVPAVAEYHRYYGVAERHLEAGVLIMHPGPVNRDVEIQGDVVLSGSSLIPVQVASGIAVRSAVLVLATGAIQKVAA